MGFVATAAATFFGGNGPEPVRDQPPRESSDEDPCAEGQQTHEMAILLAAQGNHQAVQCNLHSVSANAAARVKGLGNMSLDYDDEYNDGDKHCMPRSLDYNESNDGDELEGTQ